MSPAINDEGLLKPRGLNVAKIQFKNQRIYL